MLLNFQLKTVSHYTSFCCYTNKYMLIGWINILTILLHILQGFIGKEHSKEKQNIDIIPVMKLLGLFLKKQQNIAPMHRKQKDCSRVHDGYNVKRRPYVQTRLTGGSIQFEIHRVHEQHYRGRAWRWIVVSLQLHLILAVRNQLQQRAFRIERKVV